MQLARIATRTGGGKFMGYGTAIKVRGTEHVVEGHTASKQDLIRDCIERRRGYEVTLGKERKKQKSHDGFEANG